MSQALAITLAESATVSASGSGSSVDIGALRRALKMTLSVTDYTQASSGSSVLVTLQTRASSALPWRDVDSVSVVATGVTELHAGGLDEFVRITWTLTNMTSCEFACSGVAHVVYCDPADISMDAVPEAAIEDISASERARACISVTGAADGSLNCAFTLPITAWGDDLRANCAALAAAKLFCQRGFDPNSADKLVLDREKMALDWFKSVARGEIKPPDIIDSTEETYEGGSFVESEESRGWG